MTGIHSGKGRAPEAVFHMTDEDEPRWIIMIARTRPIVFGQHTSDDILVDVDTEYIRYDHSDSWTAVSGVTSFQFNDYLDNFRGRNSNSLWLWLWPYNHKRLNKASKGLPQKQKLALTAWTLLLVTTKNGGITA